MKANCKLFKKELKDCGQSRRLVRWAGLLTFAIVSSHSEEEKTRETERALEVLVKENGLLSKDLEKRVNLIWSKSSFWPLLLGATIIGGLAFAKEKYLPETYSTCSEHVINRPEKVSNSLQVTPASGNKGIAWLVDPDLNIRSK